MLGILVIIIKFEELTLGHGNDESYDVPCTTFDSRLPVFTLRETDGNYGILCTSFTDWFCKHACIAIIRSLGKTNASLSPEIPRKSSPFGSQTKKETMVPWQKVVGLAWPEAAVASSSLAGSGGWQIDARLLRLLTLSFRANQSSKMASYPIVEQLPSSTEVENSHQPSMACMNPTRPTS